MAGNCAQHTMPVPQGRQNGPQLFNVRIPGFRAADFFWFSAFINRLGSRLPTRITESQENRE